MCTGFSLFTNKQHHYLARTMDFAFEFNSVPIAVPRNYHYQFDLEEATKLNYGFIGTGVKVGRYRFGDGINEHGLSVSNHYFTGEASYATEKEQGFINLAPEEFIVWVLGFVKDIADLKYKAARLNIMNIKNPALDVVPLLHFLITDRHGYTVAVEPHDGKLIVKDNYVNVLTNAPNLEWHIENLRNYPFLTPTKHQPKVTGKVLIRPMGVEGGTAGLPGGYTSTERFVRASYLRNNLEDAQDETTNITNCFKVLDAVSIPRGAVIDAQETHYTQYQLVLDSKTKTYYIKPYYNNTLFQITLTEALLSAADLTYFPLENTFSTVSLNDND
ncbi:MULTISPECIES: choloylglycine hydrolase family protein [Staphylococcus]|uniref:choloylglycine hydrolase family protein n=1 Tax=Staphylococcus TaxID=1279 RepID=UPI00194EA777|nr:MULTISPECIES: choloylglycine hydrolase family protein [Staphylococcus]MCD8863516.1 choloylglycine hydrolase family protein [Staphylococcus arlettae]